MAPQNAAPLATCPVSDVSSYTTSTSGIFATGLKKWIPIRRSGFLSTEEISASGMADVLVASTASGFMRGLNCRKQFALCINVFKNGFDDDIGLADTFAVHIGYQAAKCAIDLAAIPELFLKQGFCPLKGGFNVFEFTVLKTSLPCPAEHTRRQYHHP